MSLALKRPSVRLILGVAVFIIVFFMTSCSALRVGAAPAQEEPLAAKVNGQPIPLAVLDKEVNRRLEGIRFVGDAIPQDLNAFRSMVLDTMIQQMLIEQAAQLQGVEVPDTDLDVEINLMIEIAGSRENWLLQLQADRLTEEEFRAVLRSALITQKMRDLVTASACVGVEQVHARHILVADETTATVIRDQIIAGADFAGLAKQFSLDVTTRDIGGDLGWFVRGQLLQLSVEEAAFVQDINSVSVPVKTDLGYHIVQTLERASDRPVDQEMCYRLSEASFEAWLNELLTQAQIERFI